MIKMVRVDHRLVHGQVAFTWTKFLGADCILIASDEVARDELRSTALRMAKPNGVKLVIKNIEDSAKALNSSVTDKYQLFVLVESVEDVYRLCQRTDKIREINLGGTRSSEDRKQISMSMFVSGRDCEELREMIENGMKIQIQMTPNDPIQNVSECI